jgi:molecular chaperone DnaK
MQPYRVGIDLGTSFCSVAWMTPAQTIEVLRDDVGDPLTPSAVYFHPDGTVVVGKPALAAGEDDPDRLLVETKRLLGDPDRRWVFGGVEYTPVDVAAILLRHLRAEFEARVGPIGRAVVTVPVHFSTVQRRLMLVAMREAGLPASRLLNEPVAAALAYLRDATEGRGLRRAGEQLILVYDLGGGTFDLSLVRFRHPEIEVVRADGKLTLGGADFSRRLENYLADWVWVDYGVDLRAHPPAWRRMVVWAEDAKRRLSDPGQAVQRAMLRLGGRLEAVTVSREVFEAITLDLVRETVAITDRLLAAAGVGPADLSRILAVGGGSQMPAVRRVLARTAGHDPEVYDPEGWVSPELAVVEGAAVCSQLWSDRGTWNRAAPVVEVSSRSIGVAVRDAARGPVHRVVIPKNTRLPVSRTIPLHLSADGRRSLRVNVTEGDEEDLGRCTLVGTCTLADLPARLPRGSPFELTLTLDESNALGAVLQHPETGLLAMFRTDMSGRPATAD